MFFLLPFNFHFCINTLSKISPSNYQWISLFIGSLIAIILIKSSVVLQYLYITFHELSHALIAVFYKAKIKDIKIKTEYGFVKSNKDYFFIRLAPYVLPLFPLLVWGVGIIGFLIIESHELKLIKVYFNPIFTGTTILSLITLNFYNFKLILEKTSDIPKNKVYLSAVVILHASLIFNTLLLKGALNQEEIVYQLLSIQ